MCLHTGEYFHGPFETTDKKLPMILLMSEGRTRALDERCLKFLRTYAENYIVIDFEKLNGGKIDKSVVESVSYTHLRWDVVVNRISLLVQKCSQEA